MKLNKILAAAIVTSICAISAFTMVASADNTNPLAGGNFTVPGATTAADTATPAETTAAAGDTTTPADNPLTGNNTIPTAGDTSAPTDASKGKGAPDTGVEDLALGAGVALVAAGAIIAAKKRK